MELTTSYQKIGTGSTVTYGGSAGHLELWAKYNSQDIPNNKTNVSVELRLVIDYGYIGNYQATYWGISGDLSNSGNLGSGDYRSRTLGSATGNITHNSDGTKSVSFSGSFNPTAWGYSMSVSGSATLPNLHKPPVINTATMVETNSVLTALNVPDTTIVQYLSKKTITLDVTSYDGATKTYRLRHFNTNYNIPSSGYQNSNVFNTDYTQNDVSIGSGKANIIQDVKDSYNAEATDWVYVNINGTAQKPNGIAYTKPSIIRASTSIKRKSGGGTTLTDNKAVLNFNGTFYKENNVIGNNNNIQQIGYKIWEKGTSEPATYTSLTPTISGGNITITNYELSNLIYTKTYNYKIILKDRYGYQDLITDGTLPTGVSVFTEYKDRVDFEKITIKNQHEVFFSKHTLINTTTGLDITFDESNSDKFTFIIIGHDNGTGNMNITVGGFYKNSLSDCSYSRLLGNKTLTRKSQYVYHIDATQWSWYYVITPPGIVAKLSIPNS